MISPHRKVLGEWRSIQSAVQSQYVGWSSLFAWLSEPELELRWKLLKDRENGIYTLNVHRSDEIIKREYKEIDGEREFFTVKDGQYKDFDEGDFIRYDEECCTIVKKDAERGMYMLKFHRSDQTIQVQRCEKEHFALQARIEAVAQESKDAPTAEPTVATERLRAFEYPSPRLLSEMYNNKDGQWTVEVGNTHWTVCTESSGQWTVDIPEADAGIESVRATVAPQLIQPGLVCL